MKLLLCQRLLKIQGVGWNLWGYLTNALISRWRVVGFHLMTFRQRVGIYGREGWLQKATARGDGGQAATGLQHRG